MAPIVPRVCLSCYHRHANENMPPGCLLWRPWECFKVIVTFARYAREPKEQDLLPCDEFEYVYVGDTIQIHQKSCVLSGRLHGRCWLSWRFENVGREASGRRCIKIITIVNYLEEVDGGFLIFLRMRTRWTKSSQYLLLPPTNKRDSVTTDINFLSFQQRFSS